MCYMRSSNLTFVGRMLFRDEVGVAGGVGGEHQRVCEEGGTHGIRRSWQLSPSTGSARLLLAQRGAAGGGATAL